MADTSARKAIKKNMKGKKKKKRETSGGKTIKSGFLSESGGPLASGFSGLESVSRAIFKAGV